MDARIQVLIAMLFFAVLAFLAGILLWKHQTKGELTLKALLQRSAPHGPLVACAYSGSGDRNGNVYTADLTTAETGETTLIIRQKQQLGVPLEAAVYRADKDALEQLSAIVEHYNMAAWTQLPPAEHPLPESFDTGISLIFTDTYVHISYASALPDEAFDALHQLQSCLFQWQREDRLLERYTEDDER